MTEPTKKEIYKVFDEISPTYDCINRILSLGMDPKWRKQVCSHFPEKSSLQLLDLATGTGDQILAALKAKPWLHAVGIDLAEEMIAIGKKKLKAYPNVELQVGDAQKIPFKANHFDVSTFSFGIRNVLDPLESLKEIHRVLKPRGRSLVLEFSLPPQPIRMFHLFYLRHVLPKIGGWLSGRRDAYRYLNQTIEDFPSGSAFCDLMRKAGFTQVKAQPLLLGAVTIYQGDKR